MSHSRRRPPGSARHNGNRQTKAARSLSPIPSIRLQAHVTPSLCESSRRNLRQVQARRASQATRLDIHDRLTPTSSTPRSTPVVSPWSQTPPAGAYLRQALAVRSATSRNGARATKRQLSSAPMHTPRQSRRATHLPADHSLSTRCTPSTRSTCDTIQPSNTQHGRHEEASIQANEQGRRSANPATPRPTPTRATNNATRYHHPNYCSRVPRKPRSCHPQAATPFDLHSYHQEALLNPPIPPATRRDPTKLPQVRVQPLPQSSRATHPRLGSQPKPIRINRHARQQPKRRPIRRPPHPRIITTPSHSSQELNHDRINIQTRRTRPNRTTPHDHMPRSARLQIHNPPLLLRIPRTQRSRTMPLNHEAQHRRTP